MSWFYGKYACGHTGRENITGPEKNRQYIANKKFSGLCPECWKKQQEEKAAQINVGLPELTGTEKQVSWALHIRAKMIETVNNIKTNPTFIQYFAHRGVENIETRWQEILETQTTAKWWIDHRDSDIRAIIRGLE